MYTIKAKIEEVNLDGIQTSRGKMPGYSIAYTDMKFNSKRKVNVFQQVLNNKADLKDAIAGLQPGQVAGFKMTKNDKGFPELLEVVDPPAQGGYSGGGDKKPYSSPKSDSSTQESIVFQNALRHAVSIKSQGLDLDEVLELANKIAKIAIDPSKHFKASDNKKPAPMYDEYDDGGNLRVSHYYDIKGEPRYTVPYADPSKGERPTTLRDAKKNNWLPSVTTVMSVVSKPGLDIWKRERLLEAVFSTPYTEDVASFKRAVIRASESIANEAANRGSVIHDSLEKYFVDKTFDENEEYTRPVIDLLNETFTDKIEWVSEKSFAHEEGFAGKVDLYGIDPNNDKPIVLDFKTKMTDILAKMKVTQEHLMQLAAYSKGLGFKETRCYNIYLSSTSPNVLKITKHSKKSIDNAGEMFSALLKYWQLSNSYTPEIGK